MFKMKLEKLTQNEALSNDEIETIRKYINRRCENLLDVQLKIVDEVQLTTRGKFNWAVNNVKKQKISLLNERFI